MAIGQIFTPMPLARQVLDRVAARPLRILDPACGTGNFLKAAAEHWPGADLVGFEAHPATAASARGWLAGAIGSHAAGSGSRIEVRDALTCDVHPEFDLVCGNPPYAAAYRDPGDRQAIREGHVTARGSFDMAVPFVERAARWLAPGGWLAMVVTNKLLVKDYAGPLRRWLLQTLAIREVWDLAAVEVFEGAHIDAAVILAQRAEPRPIRVVLADKRQGHHEYRIDPATWIGATEPADADGGGRIARSSRRWEVYVTPSIGPLIERIQGPAIGELPGITVRDGIQGRRYHEIRIAEGDPDGLPIVGVGRIEPGRIAWDKPLKRGKELYRDPRTRVQGAFRAYCERPKILIRGISRRVVAVYAPLPVVPLTAVRSIVFGARGEPASVEPARSEPQHLVSWLNSDLVSFLLQSRCRGDRVPGGSFNISKRWLEELPVPAAPPVLTPAEQNLIQDWFAAFGV